MGHPINNLRIYKPQKSNKKPNRSSDSLNLNDLGNPLNPANIMNPCNVLSPLSTLWDSSSSSYCDSSSSSDSSSCD